VSVVNNSTRFVDAVHADRAARFQAEARQARIDRRSGTEERRIRRAIGRSIVRVGARIAADPAPERFLPARSR
jgi:Mg-chelatase subunit ChlI